MSFNFSSTLNKLVLEEVKNFKHFLKDRIVLFFLPLWTQKMEKVCSSCNEKHIMSIFTQIPLTKQYMHVKANKILIMKQWNVYTCISRVHHA